MVGQILLALPLVLQPRRILPALAVVLPAPVLADKLLPLPGSPVDALHSPHFAGHAFSFVPAWLSVQSVRNCLDIPVLALLVGVHCPRGGQLQFPL